MIANQIYPFTVLWLPGSFALTPLMVCATYAAGAGFGGFFQKQRELHRHSGSDQDYYVGLISWQLPGLEGFVE